MKVTATYNLMPYDKAQQTIRALVLEHLISNKIASNSDYALSLFSVIATQSEWTEKIENYDDSQLDDPDYVDYVMSGGTFRG